MTRPEASGGRSVRKDKDATCRVVAKRLAWLAKDSNWDGTLPSTPKPFPPPPPGLKSGRRGIGGASPGVEQAPGWDGQVTDTTRFAADERVHNAHHGSSTNRDQCNNVGARGASKEIFTQQHAVVAGMPTVEKDKLIADAATNNKEPGAVADARLSVRWFGGDDCLATQDRTILHPELEEEEEEEVLSFRDEDTAAGDYDSNEASDRDGGISGTAHGPTCTPQASDLRGSAPSTNDTISELSCSGIFTVPSAVDDEQKDRGSDDSTHDTSSESPNQISVASPRDDDDIGASHVEHLIQERRRWKLRAIDSEHKLAAFQSLHAGTQNREGGRAMEPRSAEAAVMVQSPGSLSESMVSETFTVESGFEIDDRWQTASGHDGVSPAKSCSTPSMGRARRPRGLFDTASDAHFSGAPSATTDFLPATGARHAAACLHNDHRNRLVDGEDFCGGQGKNGDTQKQMEGTSKDDCHDLLCGNGEQGKTGTRTHRLLREEIAKLKENSRKAELRLAAAEATAASVLQRARAAELSRDVKEIQIRNLEIRLARHTNNTKNHKETCARWSERQYFGGDESADGDIKLDLLRSRVEPSLPTVVEEGEEVVWPYERSRNDRRCSPLTDNSQEPEVRTAVSDARSEIGEIGGLAAGGRRAALDRFRHGCFVLGAKAARAGGGAMSVAAAVASEAVKEAVQSAAAAVGGGIGVKAADHRCSQGERDGGVSVVEEYWGSDYLHLGVS